MSILLTCQPRLMVWLGQTSLDFQHQRVPVVKLCTQAALSSDLHARPFCCLIKRKNGTLVGWWAGAGKVD